jgi:hypothetical protein
LPFYRTLRKYRMRTQLISDKAQLTLRMTEHQIMEIRSADAVKAITAKGDRFFNDVNKEVWRGTTRKVNLMPKGKGHWLYWADKARGIAAYKIEKKHRKYWNKVAAGYQAKADAL